MHKKHSKYRNQLKQTFAGIKALFPMRLDHVSTPPKFFHFCYLIHFRVIYIKGDRIVCVSRTFGISIGVFLCLGQLRFFFSVPGTSPNFPSLLPQDGTAKQIHARQRLNGV